MRISSNFRSILQAFNARKKFVNLIAQNGQKDSQMKIDSYHKIDIRCEAPVSQVFRKLELENRPTVVTAAAAYYLNRRPQTLRGWACLENGPLRPFRISGRLAWSTAEIKRLLGVPV